MYSLNSVNLQLIFNFNNFLLYQNGIEIYKWFIGTVLMVLVNLVPLLICIAFFTVAERKLLASLQRRTGPTLVGYWGVLQAFADGFKLIIKEIVVPAKANFFLYFLAPILSLFLAFLS
jgi:NADH-ubiquinone oxidoreductase chain 1